MTTRSHKTINLIRHETINITIADVIFKLKRGERIAPVPTGFGDQHPPAQPLLEWGRRYLPHHFTKPASAMHEWLAAQLDRSTRLRGFKINLIGPRGSAKSTIGTLCAVLRASVEGREPYIWIVSDTIQQALLHLDNVKRELTDNTTLVKDYPLAVGKGRRWQRHVIELPNGVIIEAWSTGQRIRGRRRREHRPTLIVCDDLQNDSHISSPTQREGSRRWFHGTLLKAGTKDTNVLNLATALHRDALAMELLNSPGWNSRRFAAIEQWPTNMKLWDEWERHYTEPTEHDRVENARTFFEQHRAEMEAGAKVLWPEVEDLYTLMRMRVESGRAAFEREKQGSPLDPKLCEFPPDYFDDDTIWFHEWPDSLVVRAIALDPSKGTDAERGDYSAFVLLGIDAHNVIYIAADLARRPASQIVADGVRLCQQFRPTAFGVEANQFQELLADEITAEFARQQIAFVAPSAIHNYANKYLRIQKLGPYLSKRRLRFLKGCPSTEMLVEQLRQFPLAAHDDGPDALEMAIRLAEDSLLRRQGANDGLGSRLIREP